MSFRLPPGLSEAQKNMNPALAEALLMSGVIHCLPFLAKWSQNESKYNKQYNKNILSYYFIIIMYYYYFIAQLKNIS